MVARGSHSRKGGPVKAHKRNGRYIDATERRGTQVAESNELTLQRVTAARSLLRYKSSLTYPTNCRECGQQVYFYRSEHGGCTMFDFLRKPWDIHGCWKNYEDRCTVDIAFELQNHSFNGQRYISQRERLTKKPKDSRIKLGGFVDRMILTESFSFPSHRNASSGKFREVFFVPNENPSVYLSLLVPSKLAETSLTRYSIHEIEARWLKHLGHWYCFLESFQRLNAQSRPHKVVRDTIIHNGTCDCCGATLEVRAKWGFDLEYRLECSQCGNTRGSMDRSQFEDYISRCHAKARITR